MGRCRRWSTLTTRPTSTAPWSTCTRAPATPPSTRAPCRLCRASTSTTTPTCPRPCSTTTRSTASPRSTRASAATRWNRRLSSTAATRSRSTCSTVSLADTAYAYVPDACANDTSACKVHVALHGCEQSTDDVGQDFITETGYTDWACTEGNTIVLFPQAAKTLVSNPNACFDWWGYTNSEYASQEGVQLATFVAMVDALQANDVQWSS